jgi:hypothetical protein
VTLYYLRTVNDVMYNISNLFPAKHFQHHGARVAHYLDGAGITFQGCDVFE